MILQVYSLLLFTKWSDFVYRLGMDQDLSFHIWKGMNILKFQRFWGEHLTVVSVTQRRPWPRPAVENERTTELPGVGWRIGGARQLQSLEAAVA